MGTWDSYRSPEVRGQGVRDPRLRGDDKRAVVGVSVWEILVEFARAWCLPERSVVMEAFGMIGMSMGSLGFVFALLALGLAQGGVKRLTELEADPLHIEGWG